MVEFVGPALTRLHGSRDQWNGEHDQRPSQQLVNGQALGQALDQLSSDDRLHCTERTTVNYLLTKANSADSGKQGKLLLGSLNCNWCARNLRERETHTHFLGQVTFGKLFLFLLQ